MGKVTHGKFGTKIYATWSAMVARCYQPNTKNYKRYGGRGISVCDEWRDFAVFYRDMGEKPEGLSIDRIDNNGNYCKDNCRWATPQEQQRNRRDNRWITHDGETLCHADWSLKLGGSNGMVGQRLRSGWSERDAVTIPPTRSSRARGYTG